MSDRPQTPLLDSVQYPADLRALSKDQLPQLADELRQETISAVSVTGGHLGAGLGVVELTVALHYVFDTPDDRLIWDVGHQAYPHKIITGRRDRIRTLRQGGGLSGFTRRSESEYDPFGAAHSSTSISAALGFAIANKLSGDPGKAAMFKVELKMPAGYAVPAHWHPTDETVTVVSGKIGYGMSAKLDKAKAKWAGPGGSVTMKAKHDHWVFANAPATIAVSGMGPFVITYVNPKDDPRHKK